MGEPPASTGHPPGPAATLTDMSRTADTLWRALASPSAAGVAILAVLAAFLLFDPHIHLARTISWCASVDDRYDDLTNAARHTLPDSLTQAPTPNDRVEVDQLSSCTSRPDVAVAFSIHGYVESHDQGALRAADQTLDDAGWTRTPGRDVNEYTSPDGDYTISVYVTRLAEVPDHPLYVTVWQTGHDKYFDPYA